MPTTFSRFMISNEIKSSNLSWFIWEAISSTLHYGIKSWLKNLSIAFTSWWFDTVVIKNYFSYILDVLLNELQIMLTQCFCHWLGKFTGIYSEDFDGMDDKDSEVQLCDSIQ